MQQNVYVPGYYSHSQPTYNKFPQRSFGKTNPVKRSFQDSWFTNRTWLHCDEANDLMFVWLPTKTVNWTAITLTKHLSQLTMDFRTRGMLVLSSRNTILQSAMIGIDKNFCLFGLRLYVPVNNCSVMSGRSHRFLGITSTFWEVLIRMNNHITLHVTKKEQTL